MSNIGDHIVVTNTSSTSTNNTDPQDPTAVDYMNAYRFPIAYNYGWQTAAWLACLVVVIIALILGIFGVVELFKRGKEHFKKPEIS